MGVKWLLDANPCPILLTCSDLLASCQHKHLSREARTPKSPRNGYWWTVFCSLTHPVFERAPPFPPGLFRGQIPPRWDPFLLSWCGCDKGIAKYYSRELDNMLFISRTMQPFSALNKHFTQQYYPWQYYCVPSFYGIVGRLGFSPD